MILEKILETKREEVAERKRQRQVSSLSFSDTARGFADALVSANGVALIAEVKKASPSRGVIVEDFDPVRIASAYQEGGATCLSVLTDERFFHGKDSDLQEVRAEISLPILRKDFVIDEYQIYESRAIGADCILLIVAALDSAQLRDYSDLARELGMDALVEVHDEREMETAGGIGASLIGINNRDLQTFETDLNTTARLAKLAPREALLVSESAIWRRDDVEFVMACGAKAILVGESLERERNIVMAVRALLHPPAPSSFTNQNEEGEHPFLNQSEEGEG